MSLFAQAPRWGRRSVTVVAMVVVVAAFAMISPQSASARISRVDVVPSSNSQGWHTSPVMVAVEYQVRGRADGKEEYLRSASCRVNGAMVAERPEKPDDGYYETTQTLTFTIDDQGWHTASCSGTFMTRTYSCHAWCSYGPWTNWTDTWNREFKIDWTKPTVQAHVSHPPNDAGWHNEPFTITWVGTDAVSGIDHCRSERTGTTTEVIDDERLWVTSGYCRDHAGNSASMSHMVRLDMTPPVLSPSVESPLAVGSEATADPGASDSGSGVASASCEPVDTSTPGTNTVECTATDRAGNVATASTTYEVHRVPDTTITAAPSPTNAPSISFEADDPDATFECSVDGGDWEACESPFTPALADGEHIVAVRAVGAAGFADPSPETATIVVDTVAPVVTITDAPESPTTDTTPTVEFEADDPDATFGCSVDGGTWQACTSPFTTQPLDPGHHTIAVRATDLAGNTSPDDAAVVAVQVVSGADPPPAEPTCTLVRLRLTLLGKPITICL